MERNNLIVYNTIIMNVKTIFTIILSFITSRYVLYALGVDGYGLYFLVAGITATFDFFCTSMIGTTSRYTALAEGKKDIEYSKMMFNTINANNNRIILFIICAIQVFGLIMFLWILKIPKDNMLSAVVIFQLMVVDTFFKFKIIPYNALLIAKENFLFPNIVSIIQSILKLVCVFLLLLIPNEYRIVGYALSIVVLSFATRAYTKIYVSHKYNESKICKNLINKNLQHEVFSFLKYSWVGQLGSVIKTQGSNFILNYMTGTTTINAAFGVSRQVTSVSDMAFTPISQTILPQTIKSYSENDRGRFLKLTLFNTKLSIFLSWIIIIPLYIHIGFVFDLWLKETPDYAIKISRLILLSEMVRQTYNGLSMSCVVTDKIKKIYTLQPIIQFCAFLLSIVILLIDNSKLMVVFYMDILVNIIYFLIYSIFCNKNFGISFCFFGKLVLNSVIIGVASIFLFEFLNSLSQGFFLHLIAIFACVLFVSVCFYLFLFEFDEKTRIKAMLCAIVRKIVRR